MDLRHIPTAPGVYVIRNTVNGKTYVGSTTVGLRRRLRHHRSALNRGVHRNGRKGRGRPKSAEHRMKIGAAQQGSANHGAKLTEDDVRQIKRRLSEGERGRHLAAEFGVAESVVSVIKHGKSWSHVTI